MKKSEFTSLRVLKITNTSGKNTEVKIFIFNTLLLFLFLSSPSLMAQNTWAKILPGIGSFSSPSISDFNNDKVGHIILGAGRK